MPVPHTTGTHISKPLSKTSFAVYPSMPMEKRTDVSQTSFPMLPAARVQRHKTCSKRSALHGLSLYVTGEQVNK